MRMNAVLSNPKHPEYGQFTVPLPIPHNQYDGIMEALNAMDMGDPLARDCQMDEILGEYPILKRLEGKPVNIDELDYLAKRLDSFCCALEDAQFQGAAWIEIPLSAIISAMYRSLHSQVVCMQRFACVICPHSVSSLIKNRVTAF